MNAMVVIEARNAANCTVSRPIACKIFRTLLCLAGIDASLKTILQYVDQVIELLDH
jgi:hypothetical protein